MFDLDVIQIIMGIIFAIIFIPMAFVIQSVFYIAISMIVKDYSKKRKKNHEKNLDSTNIIG